jgi:two-component system sensor histidine kinase/response regulator
MEQMHSLLKRQLKRHFGGLDSLPKEWQGLFDAVNKAYWEFDADRGTLERSLDLSSQELLQANSEMRAVFQAFPDLFFRLDTDGTILDYKAGSTTDLYLPPEKLLGRRIQDIPLKDVGNKFQEAIQQLKETKSLVSIEYSLKMEKREHFYEARLLPLLENQVIVIVRNITERKRAEEALRESEERLKLVLEGAELGTWDQNMKTGEVIRNRRWAEMLGYTLEEIDSHTDAWKVLIHPDDLPAVNRITQDHRAGRTPFLRCEHRLRTKSGEWKWILNCGRIIQRDKDGKPLRAAGTHMDITERKRAEEALKASEERYRALFEASPDGILVADIETQEFRYANPAICRMLGYTEEELKRMSIVDIHPKDALQHAISEFEALAREEKTLAPNIPCLRRDEKVIYADINATTALIDGKKCNVGFFTDITKRKRAEQALIEAKEQAEAANRLKSEFLANMSHEIRTPMNAIIGMTGITLDTDLTKEQRECLNIVKESGYALLGLLDDILDLSKIEAGQMGLETIDFDLRTTVEGVADTLAHRASSKGLELACMIHHQVPTLLRGDPGRLRQILMNLGGNAVKFTEKGEVVIRVELSEETQDQVRLLFSVTDTGIGIPKDKQEKIFESFTQADGSATRKYGGTGLGLSISKRLVKLLGGQIGVESQPGKGSRFWFTATFEKQKEFKEISLTLPPDIRGLRMLVVDDNQTNRTILLKMLESFGCYAEAVEGGAKALQVLKRAAYKEKLFDLVLLDMQMPQMDGEQTLHAIKADPELKDVLVIILTSIGIRGDVARLEALGCAGYLTKPVKQSQLFDTIITLWGRQKTVAKESWGAIVTRHTIEEQKRRRVHILLAEDNPMNQKLAVTLLKKAGYSVDAVEDGRMVMEAVKRRAYDLILMDVQMPEMNGFEATQAIRVREGEAKHTPIIAMTAHAMKGDRERCLQAGMDDYISKPIEPQEFFDAIEKWTKSQGKEKDLTPYALHLTPQKSELALSEHIEPVEPIDLESALIRFEGDKEFFKEMLQEFSSYVPKQLEKLAEAIKGGDAKVVEREAHSLKGGAGNLGAKPIVDLALQLELLGRKGDLAVAEEIVSNLRTAFEHLEEYINKSLPREGALKS